MSRESPHKICVVTGSRADYGLLYWVLRGIQEDADLRLSVVATGMHLSPEFGLTYELIEQDGFEVDAKVEMLLSSDNSPGVTKSLGLGVIGFADVLARLQPDVLLVLGDRFEIFAAVQAALIARIPVAHIAGGDTTEGAFDEAIRHSITKMAHLHFVTNEQAAQRVRQLGENPAHVFNVGSPGLDTIRNLKPLSRSELENALNFEMKEKNLLITFHPVTLDTQPAVEQFEELLAALELLGPEFGLIITKPNADTGGHAIIKMIDEFVADHANSRACTTLGQLYLSTMAHIDAVVGNSSSGLYEAPSFQKPTINIGDRQKGRLQATSVINCGPTRHDIVRSIQEAMTKDCSAVVNPYGDGFSAARIVKQLKTITEPKTLLKKKFFDIY
jgi:UDP-N-acetylglucosamine 2-epimerase (non-hydrolysing)/GDP/UDP-N,N'-diacetylbacillosamine 2-epimerase (hydrolysing)